MTHLPRVVAWVLLVLSSAALGLSVAGALFLGGSRTVVLAGHDAVIRPTLVPHAVVRMGPLLPDLRLREVGPIGVTITLGKTEVGSVRELIQRYAFIASEPDAQVAKVEGVVRDMALTAALRGVGVGLVPVAVFVLLGRHRRGELFRGARTPRGIAATGVLLVLPVLVWQPWETSAETQEEHGEWETLAEFVGAEVVLPEDVRDVEILTGPTTRQTRRLLVSAVDTYDRSRTFYAAAAEAAADLPVREAEEDETVALLVSDRHDNIGMDGVARAVGEAAGATVVLDAGDDTSTGEPWEAFSLDSLAATFEDWDRYGVAGNHDHGQFVPDYLEERGWTMLDGEVVDAPWGGTLLGVDDPRSSGLGSWRDESGLSFGQVEERLADEACLHEEEAGVRLSLVLVHDANLGRETLRRGCADLVVGGHTHITDGPDAVAAEDGSVGYTYTNGTTGGAAYAIAVGSKPRRDADVTLLTFRDGRPSGVQWVRLRPDGEFIVGEWIALDPGSVSARPPRLIRPR